MTIEELQELTKLKDVFSRSPRKNAEGGRIVISPSSLETSSYL